MCLKWSVLYRVSIGLSNSIKCPRAADSAMVWSDKNEEGRSQVESWRGVYTPQQGRISLNQITNHKKTPKTIVLTTY